MIGMAVTSRSITRTILIVTTISTATSVAKAATFSTIHNTAAMRLTETGKQRTSLVARVRVELVVPVVPAVRVALVVSEDPVERAVQVALVVSEDPAGLVELVAPVVPAVRVALVVPEDPVALVVPEDPVEPAVQESPVALERELAQVAVELEHVPVVVVLVRGHPRVQLAVVALRTKSVTAAHRPGLVPRLAAEEDLVAAVAVTTRDPAVAEAVIAWEVVVTAVAEAGIAVAAAAEEAAAAAVVAVADVAAAEEEAGDKRVIDGEKL